MIVAEQNKIIGIDVDGVLRNFCDSLMSVVTMYYPEYLKAGVTEITDWQLENNFNCSKKDLQQIYWQDRSKEVMEEADPIFHSHQGITSYNAIYSMDALFEWCREFGHEFWCVTSQKQNCRHLTLSWLGKHRLDFDRVVFAKGRDKWKVEVDWLVDDSPQNWHHWKNGRNNEETFILMDAPYNQQIKSTHRIYGLGEVERIVG